MDSALLLPVYSVLIGLGLLVPYWVIRLAVRHGIQDTQRPQGTSRPVPPSDLISSPSEQRRRQTGPSNY